MLWWKEIAALKQRLVDVEKELQNEQGKAARLAGFLGRLQQFGLSPTGHVPRREFSEALIDAVSGLLQVEQVVLFLADPVSLDLLPAAARGTTPDVLARQRVRMGEGLLGKAAQDLKLTSGTDASDFFSGPYLIVPFRSKENCSGLLLLAKPSEGSFSAAARELATLFGKQAALTFEDYAQQDEIERLRGQMVDALMRAIEAKDAYTHRHSDRTRVLARTFAQQFSLPASLIREVEYGAFLHDVGKIGIDDAILLKADKLTTQEYAVMKMHPAIGQRILQPIASLRQVGAIVLYHQEWYNGAGYPEGLAGEEIPLGARIVHIIDAWDAMTSDRPYRKAMPKASAIAELRRQEGTQFDPKLVEAFLRVLEKLEHEGVPTTEQQGQPSLMVNGK